MFSPWLCRPAWPDRARQIKLSASGRTTLLSEVVAFPTGRALGPWSGIAGDVSYELAGEPRNQIGRAGVLKNRGSSSSPVNVTIPIAEEPKEEYSGRQPRRMRKANRV